MLRGCAPTAISARDMLAGERRVAVETVRRVPRSYHPSAIRFVWAQALPLKLSWLLVLPRRASSSGSTCLDAACHTPLV